MLSSQYSISQVLSESFQENELLYIEVLISIEENDLSPDLVAMIRSVLVNFESINVTGFQPSCKSQVPTYIAYITFSGDFNFTLILVLLYNTLQIYIFTYLFIFKANLL